MTIRSARRISTVLASASVVLVAADAGAYLWLVQHQHDGGPAWWFLAGLCVAILLGIGSLLPAAAHPDGSAIAAGVMLLVLGILGIFSVGLPLLLAGLLMLLAAAVRSAVSTATVS